MRWHRTLLEALITGVGTFVLWGNCCAEVVTFGGRAFILAPPVGYCALGSNDSERSFVQEQREIVRPRNELLQASVPCDQLKSWNEGKLERFSRWAQVQAIANGLAFKKFSVPREAFIRSLSKKLEERPVDLAKVNRRMQEVLAGKSMAIVSSRFEIIGSDSNVAYVSGAGSLGVRGATVPVAMFGGITLVKEYPIGVYVYETELSPASGSRSASVANEYLKSVIEHN